MFRQSNSVPKEGSLEILTSKIMRPLFFGVSTCDHKSFMSIHATKTDNPFFTCFYTLKKPINNQMKSNTVPKVGSIENFNYFFLFSMPF